MPFESVRRRAIPGCAAALTAAALMAVPAAAANAGVVAPARCPEVATAPAFAPWGDFADYFMAPGGDFEDGAASWELAGGAATVEGSAPSSIGGAADQRALAVPAGGSATSPVVCIGVEHRSMRFFARGATSGAIRVEAVYDKRTAKEKVVQVATVSTTAAWAPTDVLPLVVNDAAADYGNALPVALRFSAVGTGSWQIDDVYVDPRRQ